MIESSTFPHAHAHHAHHNPFLKSQSHSARFFRKKKNIDEKWWKVFPGKVMCIHKWKVWYLSIVYIVFPTFLHIVLTCFHIFQAFRIFLGLDDGVASSLLQEGCTAWKYVTSW